jgi:hypothetical protein
MFKGSLLLLLDSCTTLLSALTHPPSLLANQGRLWTFDLNKSQVRGRCNCVRDIRSHCQAFCACMLLSRSEHMLAPSWSRENWLVKIFCLLSVCFWHQRVTNSNIRQKKSLYILYARLLSRYMLCKYSLWLAYLLSYQCLFSFETGCNYVVFVVQADLKLRILLLQPPECWDCRSVPSCLTLSMPFDEQMFVILIEYLPSFPIYCQGCSCS